MFDLHDALRPSNGIQFDDFEKLRDFLRQLRLEHLGELPPELTTRELLLIARQHQWIREDENGRLHIAA